jgi:hypothetical protein
MVDFDADYILDTFHDQVDQGAHRPGQAFAIDFSPDDLHKAEISGGPPYAIEAPNLAVDGIVLWEIHQTTFVNYLRTVIQHAGLGGLSPGTLRRRAYGCRCMEEQQPRKMAGPALRFAST